MKYNKTVILKNGEKCLLKSADAADGAEVLDVFLKTHGETDHLLTYVDENTFTAVGDRLSVDPCMVFKGKGGK